MTKEIFGVKGSKKECTDKKCPFHGEINVKSELFKGCVVKKDINRSATIEWFRPFPVPKYERLETRRSRMRVHNPACIDADAGDEVLVARTRPLSKSKNHVVIKIIGRKRFIDESDEKDGGKNVAQEGKRKKKSAKDEKSDLGRDQVEEGVQRGRAGKNQMEEESKQDTGSIDKNRGKDKEDDVE